MFFSNIQSNRSGDRPTCMIFSTDKFKIYWDIWIVFLLIFVCIIIPYRIAFIDKETDTWSILFYVFDFFFWLDMILTFFTSVQDPQ
jgi:hypothetical protein